MKLNTLILLSVQLILLPSITSVAFADNSGFPPAYIGNQNNVQQQFPSQQQFPVNPNTRFQQPQQLPYMNQPQNNYQQPWLNQQNPQFNSQSRPAYPMNRTVPNNGNFPNFRNDNMPFSNNMMPFGNSSNNGFNPFSNGNMPFSNNNGMMPSNPMSNMFGNKNSQMPFFPSTNNTKRKKAWGTERHIWPDFYTDFTDEAWDQAMSGPRDLGRMPGGWRFPYISMPDPVTVSDAITNQFPPIAEEAGNMADFSDWGIFD